MKDTFTCQELLDCLEDAAFLTDGQGRIKGLNTRAREFLGPEVQAWIGHCIGLHLLPGQGDGLFGEIARVVDSEGCWRGETGGRGTGTAGCRLEWSARATPPAAGEERRYLFLVRDVTRVREMEKTLAETRERFQAIARTSSDLIFEWDAEINHFRWFGDIDGLLGYDPGEFPRDFSPDCLHPEDRERFLEAAIQSIVTGRPFNEEYRLRRKDGTYLTVSSRGVIVRGEDGTVRKWIGVNTDVTESRRAEKALRESERLYRLLADNVNDVIWTMDMDLRFTYISPSVLHMRGYTPEEAIRLGLEESLAPATLEYAAAVIAEEIALEARGDADPLRSRTLHLQEKRKDGSTIWTEARVSYLRDQAGRPVGYLGVTREITERKRAEEERAKLEEQLHQATKMEAIGRLAGGVAHDFNNLLTIIAGYTQMLIKSLSPGDPMLAELEEIRRASDRATSLVSQLLAFGRRQFAFPRVIDINKLLGQSETMLRRLAGERVEMVCLPDAEVARVKTDPGQIEQVLINLAVNALDAMPGGGKLIIETLNLKIDEEYCRTHVEAAPGEYVVLAVSDTGCGIEAGVRQHLFEPFFTTKGRGQGTGLGLPMIYGIVKQNQGFINVYSEVRQGTTFKIFLPMAREGLPAVALREAPAPLPTGRETVLLVEDEETVLQLARKILEEHGYRTLLAGGGSDGLLRAREFSGEIHLLLTDVIMPDMNGRQLYDELRTSRPDLRVLYMSGYTETLMAHHGVIEAGSQFLQKPFSIEGMTRKVRQVLDL